MDAMQTLTLLLALFTKHLIVDFPMQLPYQYLNKGTYGHLGGILHSGLHGAGTMIVFTLLAPVTWSAALAVAILDAVIHYHIDWAKMNLNRTLGWGPTTHEQFWWLLGADQYLHALTYLGIVYLTLI